MKSAKLLMFFFSLCALASCVDTEEYIVINEDNTGSYTLVMDMGKMIGMAGQMGGQSVGGKVQKLDSMIYLKDAVMASDKLTADEKELYKDASIRIKLDKDEAEMKITMTCPIRSITRLAEVKDNFFTVIDKIKALDKLSGKAADADDLPPGGEGMSDKTLNASAAYYSFTAQPGKIEYKINDTTGLKQAITSDSTIMMMQQMMAMMGELTYKTSITAPRELKSYTGNKASLSADKKTIMFTSTFTEMLEQAGKLAYKVEY